MPIVRLSPAHILGARGKNRPHPPSNHNESGTGDGSQFPWWAQLGKRPRPETCTLLQLTSRYLITSYYFGTSCGCCDRMLGLVLLEALAEATGCG